MEKKPSIKIELTPEQRKQVQGVLGREVAVLELTAEQLEERVAPALHYPGGPI